MSSLSPCPSALRRRPAAVPLLGWRVQISLCVCCVGGGLCDELITRSEESYRLCLIVIDPETSTVK